MAHLQSEAGACSSHTSKVAAHLRTLCSVFSLSEVEILKTFSLLKLNSGCDGPALDVRVFPAGCCGFQVQRRRDFRE